MKRMNFRKTLIAAALIGATTIGATARADPQHGGYGPGSGMGPGMMGGYGPSYGMGSGMMGPEMMGGYGMGPGMMGAYGPGYGMGPGMMGLGMMGGHGMGPGMMGSGTGYGMLHHLNLTLEQWKSVNAIHEDLAKKQWDLTGKMREEAVKLRNLMTAEQRDRGAITNQYQKLQEVRSQRFQARLDAQEKIDGVLTKEQKAQLRRFRPW
ncbi:MAG: Spy/CpxP family protein refolding chaperone [Betaproteobacteria bacterium]|nr:Spy/CpxP family protein refolding chaperone [Betaproteobacteria bacterium]MDH3435888.1 Spy/CpxP family protein refolding chaperone [Betaproteobacteria bacterium]